MEKRHDFPKLYRAWHLRKVRIPIISFYSFPVIPFQIGNTKILRVQLSCSDEDLKCWVPALRQLAVIVLIQNLKAPSRFLCHHHRRKTIKYLQYLRSRPSSGRLTFCVLPLLLRSLAANKRGQYAPAEYLTMKSPYISDKKGWFPELCLNRCTSHGFSSVFIRTR